jgi:hypothetical protein
VFDMFDFTPVEGDPFLRNGSPDPFAKGAKLPSQPYSPTPEPIDQLLNNLYPDLPTPMQPPAPLPSWIPPNVQDYIRQAPSYNEGERMSPFPPSIAGGEPYSLTPQIGDINKLFHGRITQNAPTSEDHSALAKQYRGLMKLPGFAGFAGGNEI